MATVRLGFVGCGSHAAGSLMPNVPQVEEIDWAAVCDLNEERRRKAETRFRRAAYADFREMIDKEKLDAVAVVGLPQMHHQVGMACLEKGVHVFLEKPSAPTAAEAKQLVDRAAEAGKFGMVATMWRHESAHAMMKQKMADPKFGKPIHYHGRFTAPGPREAIWGCESAFRGYLLGQGVHLADCTRFLMGDVAEVCCFGVEGHGGAVSMAVAVRFTSGAAGTISLCAGAGFVETYVLAIGDGGRAIEVLQGRDLTLSDRETWSGTPGGYRDRNFQHYDDGWYQPAHGRIGYVAELRHFAKSILAGEQPRASLEDGYRALVVLEAIDESRKTGRPVSVAP